METWETLKLALRVLQAFRENRDPEDADVRELRMLLPAPAGDRSPDELACEIVERTIQSKRVLRSRWSDHYTLQRPGLF